MDGWMFWGKLWNLIKSDHIYVQSWWTWLNWTFFTVNVWAGILDRLSPDIKPSLGTLLANTSAHTLSPTRPNNMRLMKPTGNGLYALVNKALTPKANSSSSSLLEHWHAFLSILYPSQTPAHQIQLTLVNQSVSARVMAEGEGKVSVSKVGRCRGETELNPAAIKHLKAEQDVGFMWQAAWLHYLSWARGSQQDDGLRVMWPRRGHRHFPPSQKNV